MHLLHFQEELEIVWPFFAKDTETFTCPEGEKIPLKLYEYTAK